MLIHSKSRGYCSLYARANEKVRINAPPPKRGDRENLATKTGVCEALRLAQQERVISLLLL
jgi:hypothetical protein